MLINHKKPSPSLNQGISRPSPSPSPFNYSSLSCSSSTSYSSCWYYPESRYPFLQSITPQLHPRYDFQLKYTIYPFSDSPQSLASISTGADISLKPFHNHSIPNFCFQSTCNPCEITFNTVHYIFVST